MNKSRPIGKSRKGPTKIAAGATHWSMGCPKIPAHTPAIPQRSQLSNELQWTSRPSGALSVAVYLTLHEPSRSICFACITHQRASMA